jgi:hypothetical protein
MRYPVHLLFLVASTLVFGQQRSVPPEATRNTESAAVCKPESLPEDVRNQLKGKFTSWKVQEPADLNPHAHERWESEKPQKCPGIAVGQFERDKTISYGVLLISESQPETVYKFLVFSPRAGLPSYEMHVLDQSDDGGASNLFIRGVGIGKFFGESSKKKFLVQAREGILAVDSGENEYEADIYFWVGDKYERQPVDC